MAKTLIESGPLNSTGVLYAANVANEDGVTLIVEDNGGGSTIVAEVSSDNSTWVSLGSTSAKGRFWYPADYSYVRFRVSTFVSGYVRVSVDTSTVAKRGNEFQGSGASLTVRPTSSTVTETLENVLGNVAPRPSLNRYGPGNPLYIGHRGSGYRYPEYSMKSYQDAYANGITVLEQDCVELSGGGLAIMHDLTVDRTTTATGNVNALVAPNYKALTLDTDVWFRGGYGNLNPPLMSEVIQAFKGKIIFVPEAKTDAAGVALVKEFNVSGIAKDQVLITGFALSNIQPALNAGYQTLLIANGSTDKAAVWAAGVRYVGVDYTAVADSVVTDLVAYGFKVIMYPVGRRIYRDKYLAMGVHGFYTDDVEYLSTNAPSRTTDNFVSQKWDVGVLGFAELLTAGQRGVFFAPNMWGFSDTGVGFTQQGYACPIKGDNAANDYSLYFKVTHDANADATRWAAVTISDASIKDLYYQDGIATDRGYTIAMRKNGGIDIFRKDGTTGTNVGTYAGAAIADGAEIQYRVTVTPAAIVVSRLNADGSVAGSATANDATYRGGYFALGHNGCPVKFRDLQIV